MEDKREIKRRVKSRGLTTPLSFTLVAMLLVSIFVAVAEEQKATEPTVDKTSVIVRASRFNIYVNDKETPEWTPAISFMVNGPIAAGSQLYVEYSIQPGKVWLTYNCDTGEVGANGWWSLTECKNTDNKNYTPYAGVVSFNIKIKNELENTNKTLFSGKFKVKKNSLPPEQADMTFYVDYDWCLPIAILTYNKVEGSSGGGRYDAKMAFPVVLMWFPGDGKNRPRPAGYLYYNGKKVGSSTEADNGNTRDLEGLNALDSAGRTYQRYAFYMGKVTVFDRNIEGSRLTDWHNMEKNPGDYEVKVLWDGKLVRYTKFTVGQDGNIVDNGIAKASGLNAKNLSLGGWTDAIYVLPVKILGNDGLNWDQNSWKTDAFWGNPLKNFTLPQ